MKSASGIEMKECPVFDRDAEQMDPSGWWFAIRPNFRYGYIECAACHMDVSNPERFMEADDNVARAVVRHAREILTGRCAQDIYQFVFSKRPEYVTSYAHAAYLGKELKKAELALALGIKGHYQE